MSLSRASLVLATVIVLAGFAGTRSVTSRSGSAAVADACPPGYVSASEQIEQQNRERRAEVNGLRARSAESDAPPLRCVRRSAPERSAELLAMQSESGRRARGG